MHSEEPSLLNHLNEVRSKYIPEGGLSTVIYCGRFQQAETATVLQVHRKCVEDEVYNSNKKKKNVTGLLIVQGNSVLHLLEGPSDSLVRILSGLSQHEHFLSNIQFGRIVYSVEDRPQRYFPEWYSSVINQEKKSKKQEVSSETNRDIIHDMATGLLRIGKDFQSESHEEVELSRYADRLPGKELIFALIESNDFFSLDEYVELYGSPFHIDLDSDKAWPFERIVQY